MIKEAPFVADLVSLEDGPSSNGEASKDQGKEELRAAPTGESASGMLENGTYTPCTTTMGCHVLRCRIILASPFLRVVDLRYYMENHDGPQSDDSDVH